jgi:hypothetical protein
MTDAVYRVIDIVCAVLGCVILAYIAFREMMRQK